MSLYTEPTYLATAPTTALLSSETRPTSLSAAALSALNATLDELLQLFIHASLISPTGTSPPSTNGTPPLVSGPLGPKDVYTTERFSAGVRRVLGPTLGKNVLLEAELAIRELLKLGAPSLRGDPALRKGSFSSGSSVAATTQADDLFRLLREWVMIISGLGAACPPTGPMTLTNHLLALTPPPAPPLGTMSPQLTFIIALYAERCLFFLGEYLARAVGRVTERGQNESAGLVEVETAFAEDDTIWNWLRGMRVRGHIEAEIAAIKARAASVSSPTQSLSGSPSIGGAAKSALASGRSTIAPSIAASRMSQETSLTYGTRRDRQGSTASTFGLGIAESGGESFEELMQSGKTMKVSLTPDRLRTADRSSRGRGGSNMTTSTSLPSLSSATSPPSSNSGGSVRRFQARPAVGGQGIIDEGDEDHENGGRSNGAGLLDLLNSPPPWPQEDEQPPSSSSAPNSPARRASRDDTFHPMSIAMRTQNSQNSVQTVSSTMSSVSDVSEWLSQDPKTRQGPLKAKDERKDLAHERQINHDLADFFSNSPPPPSISSFPTTNAPSTARGDEDWPSPLGAAASIKSSRKKTFSSFFGGNKGAKKSPDSEDGGLTRSSSIMSKATSVGRKTSRTRLNSNADPAVAAAAAMRASGFSDAAIRTASYSPPPNLAPSPSLDGKSTRRVSQVMPPPSHAPVVHERGSSIPGLKTSNKSVLSTSTHRSDETDATATRRTSNSGVPRSLGAPSSLATISSPPAVPAAESSLAPALYGTPQHNTEPSPHLSIAPSFQTARDGFDDAESSLAPMQQSKLAPAVIASAGVAGVAALAGGAAAMLTGRRSNEEQREAPAPLSREPESSALDDHQSRAIASGIAMASQDLGYRSSNEGFNGPSNRSREVSNSSSVLTAGPSPTSAEGPVAVDSLAPMRTLANSSTADVQELAVDQSLATADADSSSSETLTSLKQRMAAAQSPAECVALLEAFMAQQQASAKSSGVVSGAAGVVAPSGAVNGAEVAEAQEMLQVQEEKVAAEEAEEAAVEVAQASEEAERAIAQAERVEEKPHSQRMESWLSGFVASGGWSSFAAEREAKSSGGALSPVEERKEEVLEEKPAVVAEEEQVGPVDQFERRMSLS